MTLLILVLLAMPDAGAIAPVGGVSAADAGVIAGDAGVITGDAGVITGDAGVITGDAGVIAGDAGVITGDAGVISADAVSDAAGAWIPPATATRCALDLLAPMNALPCQACHLEAPGVPVECTRCHTKPPPHAAFGPCGACHRPDTRMAETPFDHTARTGFALAGPHALRRCADCHRPDGPKVVDDACHRCHADRHRGRAGTLCTDCHSTDTWLLVRFDHATTGSSLTGRHLAVPCLDCHPGGRFIGQPAGCVFCHGEDLPTGHRFPGARDCEECHTPAGFAVTRFVHDPAVATGGVHARVARDCGRCHAAAALDAEDCARCHLRDLTTSHRAFLQDADGLLDCTRCHDRAAPWAAANFFRHPLALTGAHVGPPCGSCHPLPVAIKAGAEACRGCHLRDQPSRNHPNGRDCVDCHSTSGFYPALFR